MSCIETATTTICNLILTGTSWRLIPWLVGLHEERYVSRFIVQDCEVTEINLPVFFHLFFLASKQSLTSSHRTISHKHLPFFCR